MSKIELNIPEDYETQQFVRIRRGSSDDDNFITPYNIVGGVTMGTRKTIYSLVTTSKGETWGRVSDADNKGIADWMCIKNRNTTFMKKVSVDVPVIPQPVPSDIDVAEYRRMVAWAKGKGFPG